MAHKRGAGFEDAWEIMDGPDALRSLYPRIAEDLEDILPILDRLPFRINSHLLKLIQDPQDPIGLQVIPSDKELDTSFKDLDPLREESYSPVENLTHRYPDRVLFLVSNECAAYCRFCNRRRKVGRPHVVTEHSIREGLRYIRANPGIREVLLSGGDPFMLSDQRLEKVLSSLRDIPHVEVIRIGTRVPSYLPQRITPNLAAMLKRFQPLFINIHFNHPKELTLEAQMSLEILADAGIPLGSQTVLLKGINDSAGILKELFLKLLRCRVRPYYLFQADMVAGTRHFWTHPLKGVEIIKALYGTISGLAIPHLAIDLPEGGGKIILAPEYIREITSEAIRVENFEGRSIKLTTHWEDT